MGRVDTGFFRQSIPPIELSLERNTAGVPNDGWYYVVFRGEIRGRFRQKRQAESLYREFLGDSGYRPPTSEKTIERNETLERYLDDKEAYWLESHKHTRRGGKGRF